MGSVLGAVVAVIGAAAARDRDPDPGPATPPPGASTASGTPDQISADREANGPGLSADAAIAQVLHGLGDSSVKSATLIQDPANGASSPTGASWLDIQIDSDQGDSIKQVWLGLLVQGAVSDSMRTTQSTTSEVLAGAQIVDHDRSGRQVITQLGHGSVVGGQVFNSPDDATLRDRVAQVAAKYGLTVRSVQVLHPLESALAVTFTVPDGSVDWTIGDLKQEIEDDPQSIEGSYIELDDPSGRPLLRGAGAARIPGGGLWFARGQDERFGAVHG